MFKLYKLHLYAVRYAPSEGPLFFMVRYPSRITVDVYFAIELGAEITERG